MSWKFPTGTSQDIAYHNDIQLCRHRGCEGEPRRECSKMEAEMKPAPQPQIKKNL